MTMENILLFIALVDGAVWLTAFLCVAWLSYKSMSDEMVEKLLLVCISATLFIGTTLMVYAAITNL